MNDKMSIILELWTEVVTMGNNLVRDFFDLSSEEMLDEKIEVLTKLKDGIPPQEISNFYDILEEYPKEDNVLWGTN